jgi:predicted RNA-binding protein YlxR (DUF448 family)
MPERTCILTREKLPQERLIRIFKSIENGIEKVKIQKDNKRIGRGVYLKPDLEIFDKAFKTKKNPLKYALKMSRNLSVEEVEELRKSFEEEVRKRLEIRDGSSSP